MTQDEKLDLILEGVRAIQTALAIKPMPDPVPDPKPDPVPEPPKPNPFIAWKEEGLSLYHIMTWVLKGRGLTDEEKEQAAAAGYELYGPDSRQPPDNFDASPDFGSQFGRVKYVEGYDGYTRRFRFATAPGFRGWIRIVVGESPSLLGHPEKVEITDPDGTTTLTSSVLGGADYQVKRDGAHSFAVRLIGAGRVSVVLRKMA